jgi:hypothetical protein
MALLHVLRPLVKKLGQILLFLRETIRHLNDDPATIQLDLLSFSKVIVFPPMRVPD